MKFKHLKKTVVAALTIMIGLSTVLAGCGAQKDNSVQNIKNKKELVVGTSVDFAPYDFIKLLRMVNHKLSVMMFY